MLTSSAKHILCGIAIILAVCGLIWPNYPLTAVAVILIGVAAFMP